MKTKKNSRTIPDAAMPDKAEYIPASLDTNSFIERALREANSSFDKTLDQATEDVNYLQTAAGKAARTKAEGKNVNVHDMITALEKARGSYDHLVENRNKMIEAYREILRKRT
jgi:flagellar hook-basal body complex protein FliE